MQPDAPTPSRLQSALLWVASIAVPLLIGGTIGGAVFYVLWVLSHINIQ